MGDVAMTVPIIKGLLIHNSNLTITIATRPFYQPFFENIPRLNVFPCDFQKKYKGFSGLLKLFRDLKSTALFDHIIDLHGVLRSRILNILFSMYGIPVSSIDKGRSEKKKLIKGYIFKRLKSTFQRYLDVFNTLNLQFEYPPVPAIILNETYKNEAQTLINETASGEVYRIGLAPFSLHNLKTWPKNYTLELIKMIEGKTKAAIYLFGGGRDEVSLLEKISADNNRCYSMAGKLSLGSELALIQRMELMITMDSSNMHLSSLLGVKTIALWGATHPFAGFQTYHQETDRDFQIPKEELSCRPCTIFGKGKCRRNDFACMQWLTPEVVFDKLKSLDLLPLINRSEL
jgi:ADP-heptose:LPS heptosyltransferase